MTALIICLVAALLFFALYRRRYVKFLMKFLGATVFLEAADHPVSPSPEFRPLQVDSERQPEAAIAPPDQKLIESKHSN